jgi:hypothetical protein
VGGKRKTYTKCLCLQVRWNNKSLRFDDRFVFSHLLNAEFDGSLSVWVPLAHHGEYLRNACLRIDEHLQTFQTAQVEVSGVSQLTLSAKRSFRRRMGHWIRSRLIRLLKKSSFRLVYHVMSR